MLDAIATVFIVDPDPSVRAALETLIRRSGWNAETFASAGEFLAGPRRLTPSCMLLDSGVDDIELQPRIGAERSETAVIVTGARADTPTTVRAMRAGAVEFLIKPLAIEDLRAAVQYALAKSQIALRREVELLELRRRYRGLRRRQREVMAWVVAGRLNKQIGAALGISEVTVKAHRGRMMRTMKAGSLADLVGMALKLGLCLDEPPRPRAAPALTQTIGERYLAIAR